MALCFTHVIGVCCRGKDRLTEEGASFYLMDGIGGMKHDSVFIPPRIGGRLTTIYMELGIKESQWLSDHPRLWGGLV